VREPARQLARAGWTLIELPVDAQGRVRVDAFDGQASLVSVMLANNETGVLQNVAGLAAQVRRSGGWMHTDAVQALGKIDVDFRALGVAAMTLSAHKIGGPQGAGALILDKRVDIEPLIAGGGHEHGLRSGTENVAAIVGFGRACELATAAGRSRRSEMEAQRERIAAVWRHWAARFSGIARTGCPTPATSRLTASMVKRWWQSWIVPVLRWPAVRPVPVPRRSRRAR
jgi:cysteine desulfurase